MLSGFASCHLYAGFELALAIPTPGSAALQTSGYTTAAQARGRLIHSTIARALRHMMEEDQESIPPRLVIDFWDEEIRQVGVPVAETFALPAHEDVFARRTLRKWARENAFTIEDIYGVEERLEAVVPYPDGHGGTVERIVTGQLDLLLVDPSGIHATVPDWKSGFGLPAQRKTGDEDEDAGIDDRLSLEGYFQQRFYALLVFVGLPAVQSVTLREYYLPWSEPREATIWRHELPDIMAYIAALVEAFDRCFESAIVTRRGRVRRRPLATVKQWGEPSPGGHCSWCAKAADCPVDIDAREGGAVTTPVDAERMAGILIRAKRVVAQTERSLKTWTSLEGPVRVRDGKRDRFLGHVLTERVDRPTFAQLDKALLAGRDPRELYRTKTGSTFRDFSPDADVTRGLTSEDTLAMFERARELSGRSRR